MTIGPVAPGNTFDRPRNLKEAAEAFEALMTAQLLRSAREQTESGKEGSAILELAEQHLAAELSKGGGLGLGQVIGERLLDRQADK